MPRTAGLVIVLLALIGACSTAPTASPTPAPASAPTARNLHAILQTPLAIGRRYVSPPTRTSVRSGTAAIAYGSDLVVVWDLAARREVVRIRPEGEVDVLELSRDGAKLAISDGTERATLWEVASGRRLATLPVAGNGLFFNRAGDRLLLSGPFATTLYDLRTRSRTPFTTDGLPQTEGYTFLGFSSDDRTAVALAGGYWVRWSPPTAPEAIDVDFSVGLGSLSDGGTHLVAWAWVNKSTQLGVVIDVGAKRQIASWPVPEQPATHPRFSHDGQRIFMVRDRYAGDQPTDTLVEGLVRPDMRRAWSMTLPYDEAGVTLEPADGFVTVRTPHEILVVREDGTVELPRGRDRSHLPYVDTWRVHGLTLTIGSNLRGVQTWNAGPCSGAPGMCTGRAELTFKLDARGLIGTVTGVTYTNEAGQSVPGDPATGVSPRMGDTILLERIDTGVLRKATPTGDGNPYLCGKGASAKWQTECNI